MSEKDSIRKSQQGDKATNYDSYEKFTSKMKRQQRLVYRSKRGLWDLSSMDISDLRTYILETEY